ncbi:MAG TPA: crosslink repair DNA glycosylase YcaQ family protein [Streptosporangiaceae bacterium]|jgi:hypothetical protein
METAKLRAWWAHRQWLDGSAKGAGPAEVLARTGWARSVGGVNPYLQMFARAGVGRAEADTAIADVAVHELPSARGCVYVLPAADYALGLAVGGAAARAEAAVCERLGVPRAELDALGERVLGELDAAGGPLDPRALRQRLGDAVRSLGEAGKRKGVSTTLPVALGLLQADGAIRRVSLDGRLDRQRYAYARWSPSPVAAGGPDPDEAAVELARRYWAWTGGARPAEFRWFSGFTAARVKAAVAELGLVPLAAGADDPPLAFPDDAAAYDAFTPPADPAYALVGWLDGIALLRRDLPSLLDAADRDRALGAHRMGGLTDLPAQGIVDRGRLAGLWDYDPEADAIVWASFGPPADADALRAAVERTEAFVRDQLGDAKGSSLDAPAKRGPRLAAMRALAEG